MDLKPFGAMIRRSVPAVLLALLLGAAAVAEDQPFLGTAAPAFDLPALDGGNVALADQRGGTVVLHFGAGW